MDSEMRKENYLFGCMVSGVLCHGIWGDGCWVRETFFWAYDVNFLLKIRVTKLGEFSPIGRLFTLGSF
jgi:hypothetical protein